MTTEPPEEEDGSPPEEDPTSEETPTEEETPADEETPSDETPTKETPTPEDGGEGGGEPAASTEVKTYLSNTENFAGMLADMTGEDRPTVVVGAEGNDGNFAFEPPAIMIDQGATVVWEWTGEGGQHNVIHEDGEFESELTDEEGFTFETTLDSTGEYLYFCEPHEPVGMKGAVVVE